MTRVGEVALHLQDQGWRGLLPLLPHDAAPHVRLSPEKAEEVARGSGKAPGRWSRAGWSLLPDWRTHPDDAETVEAWAAWPSVGVGLRACHAAAPWVAFVDVDVLHHEAAAELHEMLRRGLRGGEMLWRVGNAPKFLVPVRTTEPVRRMRSTVVEIGGGRHMVEILGQGQQAAVTGVHPKTGRPYFWPAGGLEETEPAALPLLTPAELAELVADCSQLLLRHGPAVGRKGRPVRAEFSAEAKPLSELRAYNPALARAAAKFVVNSDWSRDDWVAWAYALRGAFGDEGEAIWLRFSAQSAKATDPATAAKVWADATRAERDGQLRAGAGTVLAVAMQEGFEPPPSPGLPPLLRRREASAGRGAERSRTRGRHVGRGSARPRGRRRPAARRDRRGGGAGQDHRDPADLGRAGARADGTLLRADAGAGRRGGRQGPRAGPGRRPGQGPGSERERPGAVARVVPEGRRRRAARARGPQRMGELVPK